MFLRFAHTSLSRSHLDFRKLTYLCSLTNFDFQNKDYTTCKSAKVNHLLDPHQKNNVLFSSSLHFVVQERSYAKKRGSKKGTEIEESDSESDDEEENPEFDESEGSVVKNVQSLRLDSILKAGLGLSKSKIEKEFYSSKIRVNGEKVLKKARTVIVGDDVDIIKGPSPDNDRFILVDRVSLKSIGKVTGGGNYPVHLQLFKSLTIENYSEPWIKSNNDD